MISSLRVSEALVVWALQPPAASSRNRAALSARLLLRIITANIFMAHLESDRVYCPLVECSVAARESAFARLRVNPFGMPYLDTCSLIQARLESTPACRRCSEC